MPATEGNASARRWPLWPVVALACTVLVGALLAASRSGRQGLPAADASESARAAPSEATATPASAPAPRKFSFSVAPPDAEVTIDGDRARVEGDQVTIEGQLGTIRNIRLRHRGAERHYEIALTERGALPNQLSLVAASSAPRKPRLQRAEPPVPRAAPSSSAPSASASHRLDTSLDEFE